MIYINVFFMLFSSYIAYKEFSRGNDATGHLNAFAAAINLFAVAVQLSK